MAIFLTRDKLQEEGLFCSVLPVQGYSQSIMVGKVGQQEWVEGGVMAGA